MTPGRIEMDLTNNGLTFRRRLVLTADQQQARGEVLDNVHHFIVTLDHDGDVVTAVRGEAIRFPWTTCPGAVDVLEALVGSSVVAGTRPDVDQAQQCTHMLDTAKLAIAQIARGGTRTYDIEVRSGDAPHVCHASIARDGDPLFEWMIDGDMIVAPAKFAGHHVRGTASWSSIVAEDADLREAALALRRCLFVFRSRPRTRNLYRANQLDALRDVCFSFQSRRVDRAVRPPGFTEYDPWSPPGAGD
jgi:hypothetical protein